MDDGALPWWSVPRVGMTALALLANASAQLVPGPVWQQHPPIGSFATTGLYVEQPGGALVVIGGQAQGMRTWRWTTAWQEVVGPVAPPLRLTPAIAYDAGRGVAVLFGGLTPGTLLLGDTWEFDGSTWAQRTFPTAPSPRFDAAMAYDPVRQRIVLFGGNDLSTQFGDTWEYDGVAWTLRTLPTAPSSRAGAVMTFDATLQRLLLVGGGTLIASIAPCESWTFDGTSWQLLTTTNVPPPRVRARLGHDPVRGRTVLFGGQQVQPTSLTDTWEFDGVDWQSMPTTTAPAGLYGRGLVWSPQLGLVCQGGAPGGVPAASAGVYRWDGANWSNLSAEYPFFCDRPGLAFDSARDCLVLHGGGGLSGPQRNTWEWHQGTWTQTASNVGPSTPIVYDARRQCVVAVDGGVTWEYRATGWLARTLSPVPSNGPIWFDRHDGVVRVSPGSTIWSFDGNAWATQLAPGGSAFAHVRHLAAADRSFGTSFLATSVRGFDGLAWTPAPDIPDVAANDLVEDVRRGVLLGVDAFVGLSYTFDGAAWTTWPLGAHVELDNATFTADAGSGRVFGVGRTGSVWELDWPGTASLVRYGRGCPGSAGTPRLDRISPTTPQLGQLLPLRLSMLPPSPGVAVLALGDSIATAVGLPLPLSLQAVGLPGCSLWIPLLATAPVVHGGIAQTFLVPLPATPSFAGVLFDLQAFVLDPAAANGFGSVSNAVLGIAR